MIIFLKKSQSVLFDAPVHVGPHVRKDGSVVGAYTRVQKVAPKKPEAPSAHHVEPKKCETLDLFAEPPAAAPAPAPAPTAEAAPKLKRAPRKKAAQKPEPAAEALPTPSQEPAAATSHDRAAPFGVPAGITKAARRDINARVAQLVADGQVDRELVRQYSGNGGCGDSLNEYYTDPAVARSMWDTLQRLGAEHGTALEPSCGTGVFLHTAPAGFRVTGVELDPTSAAVALALHGDRHEIHTASFERFATSDDRQFDVVIGNPPYGPRGFLAKDDKVSITTAEAYFVDTALDKCKPGGLVALVVPTGILDSARNRALREQVLTKAEFLGAQRMPNTAFEHSHTEVTTDVIYLRKRPDDVAGALSVVDQAVLQKLGVWDEEFLAGSYFTGRGAGNVLGTMTEGWRAKAGMGNDITVEGSMHGVPEAIAAFAPHSEGRGAGDMTVHDVLDALPDEAARDRALSGAARRPYANLAKVGDTKTVDGVTYVLQGDPPRWHRVDEFMTTQAIADAQPLAARIEAAMAGGDREGLADAVRAYVDTHGIPANNPELMTAASVDKTLFRLVGAVNRKGELSDAVLGVSRKVEGTFDSHAQALALDARGDFRPQDLADRLGREADDVEDQLIADQRYAYLGGGRWTTMDAYLTGELWPKLDTARAGAEDAANSEAKRERLRTQAARLEKVIDPKSLDDVDFQLNSAFLPLHVLEAYFNWRQYDSDRANDWTKKQAPVVIRFADGVYTIEGGNTWGDTKLLDKYLNRTGVKKDDKPTLDEWNREFKEWLCGSTYRDAVEELYNRSFRGFVAREFSKAPIDVPGLRTDRGVRDWHWDSLRRQLTEGKGIIADDVGLGKTLRGLLLARMAVVDGRAKKPIIVVPKSVLAKWYADAVDWFPEARILTIGANFSRGADGELVGRDDAAGERKRKYHDLTQNSYDFILISEPAFEEIDLDPATKEGYYSDDFWVQRGEKLGNAGDKRRKRIREAYEQSLASREFQDRTDAIYFNELGVDMLIQDEMHHCFPAGTLIDGRPIEELRPGDIIKSFNHVTGLIEHRSVVDVAAMPARSLCRVHLSDGRSIVSTDNHRFFTLQAGYIEASLLTNSFDVIVESVAPLNDQHGAEEETQQEKAAAEIYGVRGVRKYLHDEWRSAVEGGQWAGLDLLLRPELRGDLAQQAAGLAGLAANARDAGEAQRCFEGAQLAADTGGEGTEDGGAADAGADESSRASGSWGQWQADSGAAGDAGEGAWPGVADRAGGADQDGVRRRLPDALQGGHRAPIADGGDRGGRRQPQRAGAEGAGCQEGRFLAVARVVRVEVLEPGSDGEFERLCPDGVVYDLEVDGNHNFFAEGVLVHNSKNLYAARARFGEQPKFLGGQGLSNRALDFNLKTRWVRENNGGKNVYGLTATPTKNSPLEIYSMLSHIAPEAFERIKVRNSEEFLDRFCEFANDKVLSTSGDIEDSLVVTGFKNLTELREIMGRYIDRRTAEQVGLKLPERDDRMHLVDMTPKQQEVYATLRELAEKAKEKDSTGEAHIFSVMDKMNKAALDLQLLDAAHAGAASPKYAAIAGQVKDGLKDGAQIVFSEYIDSHERIAAALTDAGVPRNRIGIINAQVAGSAVKRQNIANALNTGKLDVVIGNATMAEGLDMQIRTTDIHHADVPWEPSTLQQRNGRGLRQGNRNEALRIHTYLSRGSFDGYRYQSVRAKKDWQDLLWNGGDRVENLAREGQFSREDLRIMLAADPEAARAEFEKDKAAAQQRYDAGQRTQAQAEFVRFAEMTRSYGALKNKNTASANRLRQRLEAARTSLFNNKYFPAKAALDSATDVVIEPQTGLALHAGVAFRAKKADGSDEGKFVVTGVNMRAGTVTARRYADTGGSRPVSVPVSELASGIEPFKFDETAEAAEVKAQLEAAAAENLNSLKSWDDVKALPSSVLEANHDLIQRQIKAGTKDYSFRMPYGSVPMVHKETGELKMAESYEHTKLHDTHDYLLPTAAAKDQAIEAWIDARRRADVGSEYVHTGKGRSQKSTRKAARTYQGASYNSRTRNPFTSLLGDLGGKPVTYGVDAPLVREAKRRLEAEQLQRIRRADSVQGIVDALVPLAKLEGSESSMLARYPEKALSMAWARARHLGQLGAPLPRGKHGHYAVGQATEYGAPERSAHDALVSLAAAAGKHDLAEAMVASAERHHPDVNTPATASVLSEHYTPNTRRLQLMRKIAERHGMADKTLGELREHRLRGNFSAPSGYGYDHVGMRNQGTPFMQKWNELHEQAQRREAKEAA